MSLQQTYDAIETHIEAEGYPPSVRWLATELGVSTDTAHRRLNALVEAGWIEKVAGQPRAIRLLHPSGGPVVRGSSVGPSEVKGGKQ